MSKSLDTQAPSVRNLKHLNRLARVKLKAGGYLSLTVARAKLAEELGYDNWFAACSACLDSTRIAAPIEFTWLGRTLAAYPLAWDGEESCLTAVAAVAEWGLLARCKDRQLHAALDEPIYLAKARTVRDVIEACTNILHRDTVLPPFWAHVAAADPASPMERYWDRIAARVVAISRATSIELRLIKSGWAQWRRDERRHVDCWYDDTLPDAEGIRLRQLMEKIFPAKTD